MGLYRECIAKEMEKLGKLSNTIFLGQQCSVTDFYGLLKNISPKKRLEFPVAEELQLGVSIGLTLEGFLPISIYQRMDFLPRAMDSLVNHLDVIKEMTHNIYNPKVIIVVTVGSTSPLDTGIQHSKDLTEGLKSLLKNIKVFNPKTDKQVKKAFKYTKKTKDSVMLVFYQDLF